MKPIEKANAIVLASFERYLQHWLPDGRVEGQEYVAVNPTRGDSRPGSFKINLNTGLWSDFATGDRGKDPVGLLAYIRGMPDGDAAKMILGDMTSNDISKIVISNDHKKPRNAWVPIQPVPANIPTPTLKPQHWIYRNAKGELLGYVERVDLIKDGKAEKEFYPLTYCINPDNGEQRWQRKQFPEPRPLYGLYELAKNPDKPVLIVEGEKTADAARVLSPWAAVVTWTGGSNAWKKTDWGPLKGKNVAIWPDSDEPGIHSSRGIAELLYGFADVVKIIDCPSSVLDSWDLADALEEGWTEERVQDWIKNNSEVFEHTPPPAPPMDPPKPPDKPDPDKEPASRYNHPFFVLAGKHTRPDYYAMARFLRERHHFVCDDSGSYIYSEGRFEGLTDMAVTNLIISLCNDLAEPSELDGFKKICVGRNYDPKFFDRSTDGYLNLMNGVLELSTGQLLPHAPKYGFKYRLDINYDPKAHSDVWQKYLESVFKGDSQLIDLSLEIMAYVLMGGDPFLQRAFCLYGEGRNGKSIFLSVLRNLVGQHNASGVPLKLLDKPFSVVSLDGRIANICEETPTDTINSEFFKTAVGGGYLTASQKNKPEYDLKIKARFIFACNKFPVFKDNSTGMIDRLVFLPFTKYFDKNSRDTELESKLLKDLPAILNSIIPYALRLRESRKLTEPAHSGDLHEEYKYESCTVYAWMRESIEVNGDSEAKLKCNELYDLYKESTKDGGSHPVSRINFVKTLTRYVKEDCRTLGFSEFLINVATRRVSGEGTHRTINGIKLTIPVKEPHPLGRWYDN